MTKLITYCSVLLIAAGSCSTQESKQSDLPHAEPGPVMHTTECYMGNTKNDTVRLNITTDGNVVSGDLYYQFSEKDKNSGTVTGLYTNDTLHMDYTFNSEGVQSVREVVFLKTDTGLVEGYGAMAEKNGKMVFNESAKIDFSKAGVLRKVGCD